MVVTVKPVPSNASLIQVDPKLVPKLPAYLRNDKVDPVKAYYKAVKLGLLSDSQGTPHHFELFSLICSQFYVFAHVGLPLHVR